MGKMKKTLVLIFIVFSVSHWVYGDKSVSLEKAKATSIKIAESLSPFYPSDMVDVKEVERGKNGLSDSVITIVSCTENTVEFASGHQEHGFKCSLGLESGLIIELDSKFKPLSISYFEP